MCKPHLAVSAAILALMTVSIQVAGTPLQCYCNSTLESKQLKCKVHNYTCTSDYKCYLETEQLEDGTTISSWDCLTGGNPMISSYHKFFCSHETRICCNDSNYCNRNLHDNSAEDTLPSPPSPTHPPSFSSSPTSSSSPFMETVTTSAISVQPNTEATTAGSYITCYSKANDHSLGSSNSCIVTMSSALAACVTEVTVDDDREGINISSYCVNLNDRVWSSFCTSFKSATGTRHVACCNDGNLCNRCLLPDTLPPSLVARVDLPDGCPRPLLTSGPSTSAPSHFPLAIVTAVATILVLLLAIMFGIIAVVILKSYCNRMRRDKSNTMDQAKTIQSPDIFPYLQRETAGIKESSTTNDIPSLTKSMVPQPKLSRCISVSEYSKVYTGTFNDQVAAVKVYRLQQDWLAEMKIYSREVFAHNSVLRLISGEACIISGRTNLYLTTQYHPNGCLSLFLDQTTLSLATMLRVGASIAGGLAHLHSESLEAGRSKPALVHCNISSDNVLVKDDLTCCIADFKLAIIKDFESNTVSLPESRMLYGTARYSAPELLRGEISHQMCPFESLKQADVYALGLVLWELCIRCNAIDGCVQTHKLPFQEFLPCNFSGCPSYEDMKHLILKEERQPAIPEHWQRNLAMSKLSQYMKECWHENGAGRPSAFYFARKLPALLEMAKLAAKSTQLDDLVAAVSIEV